MTKQYRAGRRYYRVPPCPPYDIAGMEGWLSALAAEGLYLTRDGFFLGFGIFEYRKPQKVKYRLEAVQKSPGAWAENDGDPDPEQLEFSEKYAWDYVAKRQDFFIYRSEDMSARELNTDPAVQALALNAVKKRRRDALILSVFYLLIYPPLLTKGCLVLSGITMGTWWMVSALLFAALMIADELRAFLHLKRVQRALIEEGNIPAAAGGRKKAAAYFVRKVVKTVLCVILLCAFLRSWGLSVTDENKIPLAEYGGELPFASMESFAGAGSTEYTQTMTGMGMGFNTVEEKTDRLAPRCICYNEEARMKTADGAWLDGGLYVDYYELRSSALAKILARELYRLDRMKKNFSSPETPTLSADYAVVYMDELHFPTVILRKGNVVVRACFYQTSEYKLPLGSWTGILCDSLGE